MKKITKILIMILILIIGFHTPCLAKDQIKFIYIHGTNDNSYKKKLEFKESVEKIHPYIIDKFNKSEIAKKYFLQDGQYKLSQIPLAFYWGDQSKHDLNVLSDWLDVTKFFSPKLAQSVRSMLAHILHDAIWIQKYNNMKPIVDKLHKITNIISQRNDKYVILGHSAGSFIAFEYILYKLPMVDTHMIFQRQKIDFDTRKQLKEIGHRNTCLDALIDSEIAIYKRDNSLFVQEENLAEKFKKLPEIEKTSCINPNNLAGIITFGSPISLFYSGFTGKDIKNISYESIAQYLAQNDMFFLNINFAEDPLGFPIIAENGYSDFMKYENEFEYDIVNNDVSNNEKTIAYSNKKNYGFVYDKSNIRSNKFVGNAHTSYWHKKKLFSKSIIQAYEEGIETYIDTVVISP